MAFYILREAITTNTISMPAEQLVLLLQFIQPQDDHIVRVETIGGKVIYTMKAFTTGAFNLCPYEFDLPADRMRCFLERGVSILPERAKESVGGPLRETAV